MPVNPQILLDNRPDGEAVASNFKLASIETPPPLQEGQVCWCATISVDLPRAAA
jgi:hypothetical protein